jgi:hypothetical protein
VVAAAETVVAAPVVEVAAPEEVAVALRPALVWRQVGRLVRGVAGLTASAPVAPDAWTASIPGAGAEVAAVPTAAAVVDRG